MVDLYISVCLALCNIINQTSIHRFKTQHQESKNGMQILELSVSLAVSTDSGIFICSASNQHGSSDSQFTLIVEGEKRF